MKKLIPIIVLLFSVSFFAQENSKAVLVDEFERGPCDYFKAHLDFLNNELSTNPDSQVYVLIFGQTNDMRANVFYEAMIDSYLRLWKFDSSRVRFVRSTLRRKLSFQFWRVAPNATPPQVPIEEWSYKFARHEKSYKFTWLDEYDDMCPEVDGIGLYVDFLKANPTAHANVVLRDTTRGKIRKHRFSVTKTLTRTYDIPTKQIRFFEVIGTPDGMNQRIEYWLVP